MTVSADNGKSTTFITFTASTMTIDWAAPNYAGVYTATVTGLIANRGLPNAKTTTFILTVTSCPTSTDSIIILPSVTTPVNMTLIEATGGS
jgi:hypothetical protein